MTGKKGHYRSAKVLEERIFFFFWVLSLPSNLVLLITCELLEMAAAKALQLEYPHRKVGKCCVLWAILFL